MDNKLTKRRLYNFFSYEWIMLVALIVATIILWELILSVSAVRLTTGQHFKFYIDKDIYSGNDSMASLYYVIAGEDTLSYDIQKIDGEALSSDYDVLSTRLTIQEGDVIFCVDHQPTAETPTVNSRAKSLIDSQPIYDYNSLLKDAKIYLLPFLKGEFLDKTNEEKLELVKNYDNLDPEFINLHFNERMKKDNRFRTDEQKAEGRILEQQRIQKLCKEICDFEKLLNVEQDVFFRYTMGTQNYEQASEAYKPEYKAIVDHEIKNGRENAIYGVYLDKLPTTTEKLQASAYFKHATATDNVTLLVFDFLSYQNDLQFETISFINAVVRKFSTVLD